MWNLKRWYWLICFQGSNGETDIENITMGKRGGEEGEGKMYGESNMEIYNATYKIDSKWEFAVWMRERKQGLCDNLEGWDGEGDGRKVWEGWDMGVPMADSVDGWQKPTKYCKAIILQLKNKKIKILKVDNQQGPPVWHRELRSIFSYNLNENRIWKRMDTCMNITDIISYNLCAIYL